MENDVILAILKLCLQKSIKEKELLNKKIERYEERILKIYKQKVKHGN
jgi:hypothetical protein